jgi:hypothetical protein
MLITNWEIGPPSAAPDIRGKRRGEAIAQMERWFFENFEHPAASCPREGGEWQWHFAWGGPHDARRELEWAFGDAAARGIVDAVVKRLEARSDQWAPNGRRQRPSSR